MSIIEIFLVAVGLSMDAFAVSISKGLGMRKFKPSHVFIVGLMFGGFQALMPVLGWLCGKRFESNIASFSYWIAFALLTFIGAKMLIEAFKKDDDCDKKSDRLNIGELLILSVATSIDALAVGITFSFLKVSIAPAAAIIGCITFALSAAGVIAGNKFGLKYKRKAEVAGSIILILIGIKILFEHLGIISI